MGWEIARYAKDAILPNSNYPTFGERGSTLRPIPVLLFDDSTDEEGIFLIHLPEDYAGGGLTCEIGYSHPSTSGNVDVNVAIERIGDSIQDVDAYGFASVNPTDNVTVPSTSGHVDVVTVTFTDGADMDSLAAGEYGAIMVEFDSPGTASGDIEFHYIKIRETV